MAAGIMAIITVGLLAMISNQYILDSRSNQWDQSLNLAEAAVEIGAGEMNYQYAGGNGFQTAQGWSNLVSGTYSKTVSNFTDAAGNGVGNLTVTVSGVGGANPKIQGVGTCTAGVYKGPKPSRAVNVVLSGASRFPYGMITKGAFTVSASKTYTDSYDSSDPTKSTGGLYDAAKMQPNGTVVSAATSGTGFDFGAKQATIYGNVYTGPGASVYMGGASSLGNTLVAIDRSPTVADGIAKGYVRSDFSGSIPSAAMPADFAPVSNLGTINSSTTINSGDYTANALDYSAKHLSMVVTGGTVRLKVNGNMLFDWSSSIVVKPGTKLELYIAGSTVQIPGVGDGTPAGGGIINQSGIPSNLSLVGLSTSTSWTFVSDGSYTGTIYAPDADISFWKIITVNGAYVFKSVSLLKDSTLHYDEALKNGGGGGSTYTVGSWKELRYVSGSWVP